MFNDHDGGHLKRALAAARFSGHTWGMCNRVVQKGRLIKPGEELTVLLKGPNGFFELPFDAVFGGPARSEKLKYWQNVEGGELVVVPGVDRFGEKNKATGEQNWEDLPPASALEGVLLPQPAGKDYRLLKVLTQEATADQLARLGNDRAPLVRKPLLWCRLAEMEFPPENRTVWTTNGELIRQGTWQFPGLDVPLETPTWTDLQGAPIVVTHWLPLEESPDAAPPLPSWRDRYAYAAA